MVDWLTELISVPTKEYPQFMAGLSFIGALDPDDALGALRERADVLRFKLAGLRGAMKAARDAGLPRLFGLEAEYEEGQLVGELKFVKGLIDDIETATLDGINMWKAFHDEGLIPLEGVAFQLDPDPVE